MNDDLEARLGKWRPADVSPALMRRLRAAEPAPTLARRAGQWLSGLSLLRPVPLACAGLLTVAILIFSLPNAQTPTVPGRGAVVRASPMVRSSAALSQQDGAWEKATSFGADSFANSGLRSVRIAALSYMDTPTVSIQLCCDVLPVEATTMEFNLEVGLRF